MGSTGGLFGSTVLDVAIGLAFVYLLLALTCTAVNEWIAGLTRSRARMLKLGLQQLLSGQPMDDERNLVAKFYEHPLIAATMRDGVHPSYLPARTFSTVVMDLAIQGRSANAPAAPVGFQDLLDGISALPAGDVRRVLFALLQTAEGSDLDFARKRIEEWFEDSMDHLSGWYKRRTLAWTVLIAALVTVSVNADTLHITGRLWTDPVLRNAVVEEAKVRAAKPRPSVYVEYQDPDDPMKPTVKPNDGDRLSDKERQLLGQMVGWNDIPGEPVNWPQRVLGWILTTIAVSLGAPFWFDVLNKFVNIRAAGKSPDEVAKTPEKKKQPPADKAA